MSMEDSIGSMGNGDAFEQGTEELVHKVSMDFQLQKSGDSYEKPENFETEGNDHIDEEGDGLEGGSNLFHMTNADFARRAAAFQKSLEDKELNQKRKSKLNFFKHHT